MFYHKRLRLRSRTQWNVFDNFFSAIQKNFCALFLFQTELLELASYVLFVSSVCSTSSTPALFNGEAAAQTRREYNKNVLASKHDI